MNDVLVLGFAKELVENNIQSRKELKKLTHVLFPLLVLLVEWIHHQVCHTRISLFVVNARSSFREVVTQDKQVTNNEIRV